MIDTVVQSSLAKALVVGSSEVGPSEVTPGTDAQADGATT